MSIVYDPAKMLKKIAPPTKIKKLLGARVTLKKTALSFVNDIPGIDKKKIAEVALKTVKGYQERIAAVAFDGTRSDAKEERELITDDPKQLIQRVQNEVVYQVHQGIQRNYGGQQAVWLPSSADEPRPEHQLNYGKTYIIGEGIDGVEPGDEYGCQCGVEILTDDDQSDQLELD